MGFELLLPVVLFILTLIIIFLLRSDEIGRASCRERV